MKKSYIVLPNGKACGIGRYVAAWKALKAMDPKALCPGFDHFPAPAAEILKALEYGLHDRINKHDPKWLQGRKWQADQQADMWCDSRAVQDIIQRRVRVYQFRSQLAQRRLSHLLSNYGE